MTKDSMLKTLFECADSYKKNLAGRNLLFICMDSARNTSSLEVVFTQINFLHMTGVKFINVPKISANAFFSLCIDRRLQAGDFDVDPSGFTELKLKVLPRLVTPNLSANMIGNYYSNRPVLETDKLVGNTRCCVGLITDSRQNPYYSPNSVIAADIRELSRDRVRIIATYRKYIKEDSYSELVYAAKKIEWSNICYPERFSYLEKPASQNR